MYYVIVYTICCVLVYTIHKCYMEYHIHNLIYNKSNSCNIDYYFSCKITKFLKVKFIIQRLNTIWSIWTNTSSALNICISQLGRGML